MRELTEAIEKKIEKTSYKLVGTAESKSSNYWYLWNESDFGPAPETCLENDHHLIKLRFSNHDAICGRSLAKHEVVAEFYEGIASINIATDTDYSDYSLEEAISELNEYEDYDFNFTSDNVVELGCYDVKVEIEDYEELVAELLTKNLA